MAQDDFTNIRISFWNRIKTQFAALGYNVTSTGNVKYEGHDFDTASATKWFEPHILTEIDGPHRQTNRNETWLFQINCFTKHGAGQENTIEIMNMVGAVRETFRNTTMSVKDWDAVGDPHVAYMQFMNFATQPINIDEIGALDERVEKILMRACTFEGRLNE